MQLTTVWLLQLAELTRLQVVGLLQGIMLEPGITGQRLPCLGFETSTQSLSYSPLAKASHMANPNTTQAGRDAPLLVVVEGGMREYLPKITKILFTTCRKDIVNIMKTTIL